MVERMSLAAVPLADAPDVTVFLDGLGVGVLHDDQVSSFPGRNDIWAGVTSIGTPVFVKRVEGEASDVRRRLDRMAAMDSSLRDHAVIRTPRLLGIDRDRRLAAFELLEDAVTATELVTVSGLSDDVAYEAGAMVGALHRLPRPDTLAQDTSEPPLPPNQGLDAISLEAYLTFTAAELEVWRILHNDREVVDAIRLIHDREQRCTRTVVHGDLRLDQLLRHRGRLYLTDWEECRIADPARDVGAFVGECVYRAVLGMVSTKHTGDVEMTEDRVLTNGAREFELLVPLIEAFWDGYRQARPEAVDDEDLAVRAVAFAGWHMFDRAWAAGHYRPRLSPLERGAAGVGRTALIKPAMLVATVGLGGGQ
jgi:predicted trehalose synthase